MMMLEMRDKAFAFTSEKGLFSAPCHVLLGLSGGADSMALLHLLTHWPDAQLQVSAVHIHHGLRGEYADRDETFVRAYCSEQDVPLTVIRADVAAVARDLHLTVEEAGRRVRYEQFEQVRCSVGADYILTAHTADDQAETILMHLIRGCGIDGLAGIPAVRGQIRRPLLCCTRTEIEAYCAQYDIPYVLDETNDDIKYTRNVIRHRVLPMLQELNPAVGNALQRVSKHAAADADYLNECAREQLKYALCEGGYRADAMSAVPTTVRRRMIRFILRERNLSTIEEAHILAADTAVLRGNGAVSLSDGFVFSVEQGVISIRKAVHTDSPSPLSVASMPCTIAFGDYTCELTTGLVDKENVHNLLLQSAIDYDKIVGKLCLRCRRAGDYLHPCGRGVGKSLKKLMNEWHIPAHLRDTFPLLCDDVGVMLVPGYACDERVRVTDATKHYLVCKRSKTQG